MLNVGRLRMLAELDRLGTIAQVAAAMSYTPSAVSQQLAALERDTGVALLQRVGRGVRLTEAARTLVGHTGEVLRILELAEGDLARSHGRLSGELRVASFQTVVITLAPVALARLAQDHPDLRVRITHRESAEAYEDLLSHHVDLIIDEEYPDDPGVARPDVDRRALLSDPLYLMLPASGAHRDARTLADLADAPWSLDYPDSVMGDWSRRVCHHAGYEPRVAVDTADPLLHLHLARTGLAAVFTPALVASDEDPALLRRLPGDPRRELFTVVRAGGSSHPAVQAFRDALAAAAEQVAPDRDMIPAIRTR